jgi:hypothetical protein
MFLCTDILWALNFNSIFPNIPADTEKAAFSEAGYSNTMELAADKTYTFTLSPPENSGREIIKRICEKEPRYIIESLMVIPYTNNKIITSVDIYNALGKTKNLQGRMYNSHVRGRYVPLFEYVSRINNLHDKNPIGDPPPTTLIPVHEEIYFRVKDINFGNCYYKSELSFTSPSISYYLRNIEDISFYLFTVIKKENLNIYFYIEPIDEGLLLYAITGIEAEKFAASYVSIPSAAKKRFDVIKGWIVDNINS